MPIYEYYCECGRETEVKLSYKDSDVPQICECGRVMSKRISLSGFTMKPTGKQMALDTLNSNAVKGNHKRQIEQLAERGI